MRRAIVRTAVQRGIREVQENPKRGIRKMVDLGSHLSKGRFQKSIFQVMQKELSNPSSAYYALTMHVVSTVRPEFIEHFGINIGYNSWTHGAEVIRQHEAEHKYNVPWCMVLDLERGVGFDVDSVMSQGEQLGIYTYFVFTGDPTAVAGLFPIFNKHRDCAVFLLMPDYRLPQVNYENVGNVMMLLPCADEGTIKSAKELARRRCLYGLWTRYDEQNAAHILNGDLEKLAVALGAPVVFVAPAADTSAEVMKSISDYTWQVRESMKTPAFVVELFSTIEEIDRVISVESCMLGIAADGTVFTAQGLNENINIKGIALVDVLMCTMPRVTYDIADTKE